MNMKLKQKIYSHLFHCLYLYMLMKRPTGRVTCLNCSSTWWLYCLCYPNITVVSMDGAPPQFGAAKQRPLYFTNYNFSLPFC